ncbi:hypothetical protein GOP47_0001031 [Adiantum capillus-veneris]|uniref:Legumain prodomain domain-containing protein n=1 Tax=Adiantum capillus-veneris TaxID=13818 RepID=A0A9D4VEP4_ADICA|nr:hypothetical protein GOP47_0000863 [Adiantum capillus-veneris]KAI5084862.1 hypothetical protein GOP47_0001031 [Adiantum capillus-veneris]
MRKQVWLVMAIMVLGGLHMGAGAARHPVAIDQYIRMPTDRSTNEEGTKWAILLAGSSGYGNYRHQADVCHAYHVLRKGGLEEENIVVFMYDDIADNSYNPRPGQIINNPAGIDVYAGVPKDYTGSNVTVDNFLAVLLGEKDMLTGGSGKVVDSGPDDHIFIFYSDHGGPGVLGMPTNPNLYAVDLIDALQKKHDAGSYKEMVIYVEACESGSIFEGLLPGNLSVYATTASNAEESSWGTYCPGMDPSPPAEYFTCLGDLYSVAWMEDSEIHNLEEETLKDQYSIVKKRTSNDETYMSGSHVMQYGDNTISAERVYEYLGNDAANKNSSFYDESVLSFLPLNLPIGLHYIAKGKLAKGVHQRDADLLFLWHKFKNGKEGSQEKLKALEELLEELSHRMHLDKSVKVIEKAIAGDENEGSALKFVRPSGAPLVDDWMCLKTLVRTFELHCGSLKDYGMRHMRTFANVCNAGVKVSEFEEIASSVCAATEFSRAFSPLEVGFSA